MVTSSTQRTDKRRFYERALTEAERADLATAMALDGFGQEIAALRLRLRTAIAERPQDLPLVLRGMDVLRRMVASKYGLSKTDQRALSDAFVAETLRRVEQRGEGGDAHDDAG